ncbi:MAG TPA: glycosyltransferase [Proteiniclasticum sp.]|uniref:glycosyltransferase n=1 Tax=Proteiniclasticum sp. TaxID=2053595 RepID=UPI000E9BAABA|nr:glycosyltransferase [Proteiniclasticum sp.]HBW13311.1 glycosyltransferase [Proteiniclasticum sp.]
MIKLMFFMQSLGGGGAERTIINLLNKIDKNKFLITLVIGDLSNNAYKDFLSNDIKVIDLKTNRARYSFVGLRRMIKNEQPDIVFTTINSNNLLLSLVKLSFFSKRFSLIVREASYRSESKKVSSFNRMATKYCYNIVADGIIALSKGVKEDLVNWFGVESNKITVIYNPVDYKQINEMSQEDLYEIDIRRNEFTILSVGRLVEAKDYPTLLKAFEIFRSRHDAKLLIAGEGELMTSLESLVESLNLKDSVQMIGFVENPYKYMYNSNLFVLSSKYEGFGHVIVEAMASGVPVIATNCKSGPSEIITDKYNGRLVEVGNYIQLADTMEDVLMNEDYNLVNNASKRVLDFDADKITREYENYFEKFHNPST